MPVNKKILNEYSRRFLREFKEDLLYEQGAHEKTVIRYMPIVINFGKWVQKNTTHHSFARVRAADIVAYRKDREKQHQGSGFATVVAGLRQFYGFMVDKEYVLQSPISTRFKVRTHKNGNITDVPSMQQFLEIRQSLDEKIQLYPESTHPDYRFRRLLFEGLAGTGMRLGAMATLIPSQIRWEHQSIFIDPQRMDTKHDAGYEARMTPYFAKLLREWIDEHSVGNDEIIFFQHPAHMRKWISGLAPKCLWGFHPHTLRYFFACAMYWRNLDGGRKDIIAVRDYLGHYSKSGSGLENTDKYTQMSRRILNYKDAEESDRLWTQFAYGNDAEPLVVNKQSNTSKQKEVASWHPGQRMIG